MDTTPHLVRAAVEADLSTITAIQQASPEASQWPPDIADTLICDGGFLVSRSAGPDEREILNLAVEPARRKQGIARALWLAERKHPAKAWFLEVRASNTAAIACYRSLGFELAGRRKKYYANPVEDALVMKFLS